MGGSIAMRRALQVQHGLSRWCSKPVPGGRGTGIISGDEMASAAMDKILGRWENVENRVASAVTKKRGKRAPPAGLHKGRRTNRPRLSEEEVRWMAENKGVDIGKEPTWFVPADEVTLQDPLAEAIYTETAVARTARIIVAPEMIPQLEALYSGEIASAYDAAPGFSSAQLFVQRDTGEVQSVTVWESPGHLQAAAEMPTYKEAMMKLSRFVREPPEVLSFECVYAVHKATKVT